MVFKWKHSPDILGFESQILKEHFNKRCGPKTLMQAKPVCQISDPIVIIKVESLIGHLQDSGI